MTGLNLVGNFLQPQQPLFLGSRYGELFIIFDTDLMREDAAKDWFEGRKAEFVAGLGFLLLENLLLTVQADHLIIPGNASR